MQYNEEQIEGIVIGCCLNDPYALYEATTILTSEDFYFNENKILFNTINDMANKGMPMNRANLAQELQKEDKLYRAGGIEKIDLCVLYLSSGADADYYIEKVRQHGIRFRSQRLLLDYNKKLQDKNENAEELARNLSKDLQMISSKSSGGFRKLGDVLSNYEDGLSYIQTMIKNVELHQSGKSSLPGYKTGYEKLDNYIAGLLKGTVTIIGARPSSGKTTFLSNLIINMITNNPENHIGFFTLEMPEERISHAIICAYTGVSPKKALQGLLNDEELLRLEESQKILKEWNLHLNDKPGLTISSLKSLVRKSIITDNLQMIFVDYLTRVRGSQRYANKHMEVDEISKGMQDLALEFNIPVVVLAQLNRNVAGRPDKIPIMADLRESGSIEEDADVVLLLHRPKHYDVNLPHDHTHLFVAKNRLFGELGKITFEFRDGRLFEMPDIEDLQPGNIISGSEEKEKYWYAK